MTWVFPATSILDYGYADLDSLFSFGPYVFIFLIPAITMKSFAEEKKLGTLELLFTRPVTDLEIIVGKFLASFALVLIALLPTIIYYYSVYKLGNPVGNIDTPGAIGSFTGLTLVGAVFCTMGVFASALTSNQIIAFILSAFLCFLFYIGFDSFASLPLFGQQVLFVKQVGILYHYESISRGLIDSRDLIYFLSVGTVMILLTKITIGSRQWK
jgi:ABC-2 type transport system permease protein